jgi:hypothetical protein
MLSKIIFYTLLFSSIFISSCSKDELDGVELAENYYYPNKDLSTSIQINSIYDISYGINPNTGDTSLIKIYIDLNYNTEIFTTDIFTNTIDVTNEFYFNNGPFQIRKESATNKYYIQLGWASVKNRTNSIYFKFRFLKDESNTFRRVLASNEYFFQL